MHRCKSYFEHSVLHGNIHTYTIHSLWCGSMMYAFHYGAFYNYCSLTKFVNNILYVTNLWLFDWCHTKFLWFGSTTKFAFVVDRNQKAFFNEIMRGQFWQCSFYTINIVVKPSRIDRSNKAVLVSFLAKLLLSSLRSRTLKGKNNNRSCSQYKSGGKINNK